MSEPFLTVSLGEVRARGVRLETDEAVAIVLSLGERLGWRNPPKADVVLLTSCGRVDVRSADEAAARTPSVRDYALLLHELLPEPAAARDGIAVPLYGAIARALARPPGDGQEEFRSELQRLVRMAPAEAVVAVMLRWAEAAAAGRPEERRERRSSGPNVSELRRQLRESDLHRYELLSQLTRLQPAPSAGGDGHDNVLRLTIPLMAWRTSPGLASTVLERFRRFDQSVRPRPASLPATSVVFPEGGVATARVARTVAVACAAWLMGAGMDQTPPAGPHSRAIPDIPLATATSPPAPIESASPPPDDIVLVSTQPAPSAQAHTSVKRRSSKARKSAAEPERTPDHSRNKFLRLVRRLFSA
jgi:hypothetical protein